MFRGRPGTSTSAPTPATTREEPVIARTDTQTTDTVASSAGLTQAPPRLTGKLAIANARDEEERQKRRFIDPQPNGVRISDDMLESQSATQRQTSGTQQMEIDPVLSGEVEDPSEDEGYQQDQRNIPGRRPQPRPSALPHRAPVQAQSSQPARRRRTSEIDTPNKRQRQNPGQSLVPYQATDDDDVNAVNLASTKARQIRAENRKPQRGRKPWTKEEVGALVRLIRAHGISWSYLKSIDNEKEEPALADRTAEDCRFKARELKKNSMEQVPSCPYSLCSMTNAILGPGILFPGTWNWFLFLKR